MLCRINFLLDFRLGKLRLERFLNVVYKGIFVDLKFFGFFRFKFFFDFRYFGFINGFGKAPRSIVNLI
jgi:hypothetical protein